MGIRSHTAAPKAALALGLSSLAVIGNLSFMSPAMG